MLYLRLCHCRQIGWLAGVFAALLFFPFQNGASCRVLRVPALLFFSTLSRTCTLCWLSARVGAQAPCTATVRLGKGRRCFGPALKSPMYAHTTRYAVFDAVQMVRWADRPSCFHCMEYALVAQFETRDASMVWCVQPLHLFVACFGFRFLLVHGPIWLCYLVMEPFHKAS